MAVRLAAHLGTSIALGLLLLGLAAPGAGLAAPQPNAPAAPTFTVNSFQDDVAAAPLNNGVCEILTGTGTCTLRAAIMKANHYPSGGVTIILPAGTCTVVDSNPATGSQNGNSGGKGFTSINGTPVPDDNDSKGQVKLPVKK